MSRLDRFVWQEEDIELVTDEEVEDELEASDAKSLDLDPELEDLL